LAYLQRRESSTSQLFGVLRLPEFSHGHVLDYRNACRVQAPTTYFHTPKSMVTNGREYSGDHIALKMPVKWK